MKNPIQGSNPTPRTYLYVRFSSIEQEAGDSLNRQIQKGETYCQNHNATLSKPYFVDRGVSAKDGKNRAEGTEFHKMLQTVKTGDTVLLEDNDRFGRDDVLDSLTDLRNIVAEKGITFVILSTGTEINKDNFRKSLIVNFIKGYLANEENEKKRDRINNAIKSRRELIANGEIIRTNRQKGAIQDVPAWVNSETWEVNDKASLIQSIFTQYLKGVGPSRIARELNGSEVPTFSKKQNHKDAKWAQSFIYRILQDRRTFGSYNNGGQWIKGYYPAAITEETYLKAQARMNDNGKKVNRNVYKRNADGTYVLDAKGDRIIETVVKTGLKPTGGMNGYISDLFSGLCFCQCGARVGKKKDYVYCYNRIKGVKDKTTGEVCQNPAIQYRHLESHFTQIFQLNPALIIKDENNNSAVQILKGRVATLEREKEVLTADAAELRKEGKSAKGLWIEIGNLETTIEEVKGQIEVESAKVVCAKGGSERLQEIANRIGNLSTDSELRVAVRGWITEKIERMSVDTKAKTTRIQLKTGHTLQMNIETGAFFVVQTIIDLQRLYTGETVKESVNG